jgi:hypothetical protein
VIDAMKTVGLKDFTCSIAQVTLQVVDAKGLPRGSSVLHASKLEDTSWRRCLIQLWPDPQPTRWPPNELLSDAMLVALLDRFSGPS